LTDSRGATLCYIDWAMTTLPLGHSGSFGPFSPWGIKLNALSSRVLLQTSDGQVRREARYSRGGIISPMQDSTRGPSAGTRLVFRLDPHLFDVKAQAYAHSDAVLEALLARLPWLTLSRRALDVPGGDPW